MADSQGVHIRYSGGGASSRNLDSPVRHEVFPVRPICVSQLNMTTKSSMQLFQR